MEPLHVAALFTISSISVESFSLRSVNEVTAHTRKITINFYTLIQKSTNVNRTKIISLNLN